ncbi:hypothetical protein [Streptomyces scabiei]|uniref:hypothetical protein n=1 Tax=Streptomyces scabiei TaxID=1930 RepID=UPI0029B8CFEB|nr:hypothetical protein [Streptomyces scabiei]MDX3202806.1 hypothetical protein [Streptomyces scabiei]MDX3223174.1 hypothetical protein [Streptomyces scabiei]
MSTTEKVNEELPDGEALAGFAAGALGGGARARRKQQSGSASAPPKAPASEAAKPPEAAPALAPEPPAADEPAPASAPPAATAEEPARAPRAVPPSEPEPTREPVGGGASTVPHQSAAPAPSVDAEPEAAPAETQPEPASTTAAVEVRAVPVAVARTSPLPPGLQGGVIQVQVPDLGPSGARATQCTVMISQNVRDRFARYQLEKKIAGEKEPSNALVVRRAFLAAKRNNLFGAILTDMYQRANAVDEEDYDEDGLLGEVVGRRTVRGRLRDSGQQSFRPSEQELATYDAFSTAYGFPDRSAFMEGLLDNFLPQLPAAGRRR